MAVWEDGNDPAWRFGGTNATMPWTARYGRTRPMNPAKSVEMENASAAAHDASYTA